MLECPTCGQAVDAPERDAGRMVVCPHCGDWARLVRPGEEPPVRLDARQWARSPVGARDARWALFCAIASFFLLAPFFSPLAFYFGARAMRDPEQRAAGRLARRLGMLGMIASLVELWLLLGRPGLAL